MKDKMNNLNTEIIKITTYNSYRFTFNYICVFFIYYSVLIIINHNQRST